jgi:hypothetical protein
LTCGCPSLGGRPTRGLSLVLEVRMYVAMVLYIVDLGIFSFLKWETVAYLLLLFSRKNFTRFYTFILLFFKTEWHYLNYTVLYLGEYVN